MSENTPETSAEESESKDQPTETEQPDKSKQPDQAEQSESQEDDDTGSEDKWDPERAKRKIRKLNSENENLRKRVNEAPKADDVKAKDQRISDLEAKNLRYEVGYELGLPRTIAQRLQGDSREEMLKDAEDLMEQIAPTKRPSSRKPSEALRGGLEPEKEPEETDVRKLGERMFSR